MVSVSNPLGPAGSDTCLSFGQRNQYEWGWILAWERDHQVVLVCGLNSVLNVFFFFFKCVDTHVSRRGEAVQGSGLSSLQNLLASSQGPMLSNMAPDPGEDCWLPLKWPF